jgi:hypothetical protein
MTSLFLNHVKCLRVTYKKVVVHFGELCAYMLIYLNYEVK